MPAVIAAADTRLQQLRQHVPDAGGMVIASDQTAARAYADLLTKITGEAPTVVLSDDPGSSDRISQFSAGTSRWLVAVRMVSEGVDVPRLAVGRVRHQRVDAAVLRPGDRPVRPVSAARRNGEHLPAVGAEPAAAGQRDGSPAQPRARQAAQGGPGRRGVRRATQVRAQRIGQRLRIAGRRRRAGPGDLRRLVVRHRDPRGQRRGGRLSRHPRPARRRADARPVAAQARRAITKRTATGEVPPRRRRTASCGNCAANSTRWCRSPTTAPASRTAGSTTSCAGSAAARRSRRRRRISSRPASKRCAHCRLSCRQYSETWSALERDRVVDYACISTRRELNLPTSNSGDQCRSAQ